MIPRPIVSRKRRIALWVIGSLILLDLLWLPIAVFMGAFASDSGTPTAITIAMIIMISPACILVVLVGALVAVWRSKYAWIAACAAIVAAAAMLVALIG